MNRNNSYDTNNVPIAEVNVFHGDNTNMPIPSAPPAVDTPPRVMTVIATEVRGNYDPPRRKNSTTESRSNPPNDTDSYEEEESSLDMDRNSQLSSGHFVAAGDQRAESTNQLYHVLNSRRSGDIASPALERRLRDFHFAQKKRREKYGDDRPWGILGLYDYLNGVRIDVEWAGDAAWRREHDEPYLSWTDFDQSKDTGLNRPFFTYIFMIICTFFLILSIGLNGWKIEKPSINPMIGPSGKTLVRVGAKDAESMFQYDQWWRLVSPMVLHAGVIHYFFNMLAFWFIGRAIEQSHGFLITAFIFIVASFGGTILSTLFLQQYISVGASGGIFGLIGACIADIAGNWNLLFGREINQSDKGARFRHARVLLWLVVDIVVNGIIGLTPFVDNFMHLGGMIYGFLCGLSTLSYLSRTFFGVSTSFWVKTRVMIVRLLGIIISLSAILATFILLLNDGENIKCHSCRYISCVPFPFWTAPDNKWWYCDDCYMATADIISGSVITMTCPNKATITINLGYTATQESVSPQLLKLCRANCADIYYY